MIGQLQKNFKRLVNVTALSIMLCAPNAYAETVVGRLIASDWFIIIKEESGVKTVVHTHNPPNWEFSEPVYFEVNFTNETLDENYLYILAASRPGGQDGFLGGQLNGDHKIKTGNSAISVLNSNWIDANQPNLEQIKEITAAQLGGSYGPTREAKAIGEFSYGSIEHNSDAAGIWSQQSGDDGSVVSFRIPYSALFEPIVTKDSGSDDSGSGFTEAERDAMLNHINLLDENLIAAREEIKDLNTQLSIKTKAADTTMAHLQKRDAEITTLKTEIVGLKKKVGGRTPLSTFLLWALGGLGLGGALGFFLGRNRKSLSNMPKASSKIQMQHLKPNDKTNVKNPLVIPRMPEEWPDTRWPSGVPRLQIPRKDMPIPPRNQKIDYSGKVGFDSYTVLIAEFEDDKMTLRERKFPQDMPNFHKDELIVNAWRGMAIPGSIMTAGQQVLPLGFNIIQTAYDAVGRVGYAQEGKAIGNDVNRGTAILIDEQFIITNMHVYEEISDEFEGDFGLGVEFHGEKDSDESDFYEFDEHPVIPIKNMDAVIVKLKKKVPASKRKPIKFSAMDPKDMKNDDIVVIGYPAEPISISTVEEEAMGGDTVFNVKRYSEGKIRMHQTDTDEDMLIETTTSGKYSSTETVSAICHSASTLEGNSGSAVVCKKTGELLALHFGYDMFFDHMDNDFNFVAKTNLAIPGILLADFVTSITSQLEKAA